MATTLPVTQIRIAIFVLLCQLAPPTQAGLLDNILSNNQNTGLGGGLIGLPNNLMNYGNVGRPRPGNNGGFQNGNNGGFQNGNTNNQQQILSEGQKLLERLQELNRLKDENKKQEENENNDQGIDGGNEENVPDDENTTTKPTTHKPTTRKPTTHKPNVNPNKIVLKHLTKKTFMFQAQAVVPDDEPKKINETVYYME